MTLRKMLLAAVLALMPFATAEAGVRVGVGIGIGIPFYRPYYAPYYPYYYYPAAYATPCQCFMSSVGCYLQRVSPIIS